MSNDRKSKVDTVQTLDLQFMGFSGTIAAYLIPHPHGGVLIESGPGSTVEALKAGLSARGLAPTDITDVLLTHIHLDHAGAAGWLAGQGAHIHVHELGAPHLLNPEKLLASAGRIYGDMMDTLWGEFLPVPPDRLTAHKDNDVIEVGGLCFRALDTPGHAYHHFAYLFNEVCFSGDIGGVRMSGVRHIRLPMPPPEFNLELWRKSLARLEGESISRIAPTHFGIFDDPDWHLLAAQKALDEVEDWIQAVLPTWPPFEQLNEAFLAWTRDRSLAEGVDQVTLDLYETANPSWMSSSGIQRYWERHRKHTS